MKRNNKRPPRIYLYVLPGDPEEITRLKGYAVISGELNKRKYFTTDIYAKRKDLRKFRGDGLIYGRKELPAFRLRENVARAYVCYLAVAWFADVVGTFKEMPTHEYSETARELYYNVLARDDEKLMGLPESSGYIDFIKDRVLRFRHSDKALKVLSDLTYNYYE